MRLFAAVQLSADFIKALEELQERIRTAGITGRFRDPAGLHLTLAFIGEWPDNISNVLPPVRHPFRITLSHLGVFSAANVLWAGIRPSEELEGLALTVRNCLDGEGIPFDRKNFCPHITLVRKPVIPNPSLLSEIKVPCAVMTVNEISLYQSVHGRNGAEYKVFGNSAGPGTELQ